MSLKKYIRRRCDLVDVNAELLAGIREAEAARRGRGQGRPPEEEDEGEERHSEPVGSCDVCGVNLYSSEPTEGLCDQCSWAANVSAGHARRTGEAR